MMELNVDDYIQMINEFKEHLDLLEARALTINLIEEEI